MKFPVGGTDDEQGPKPLRGAIQLQRLKAPEPLRYYTYVPDTFRAGNQIVVVVHGISRNAREHIVTFAPFAQRSGVALVAPLFDREHCRGFQQLGWNGAGWRVDHLLQAVIHEVANETKAAQGRFALFGYSGGAQFAHRYALAHPRHVSCLATCASGYYTWPTTEQPFPYGADCRGLPGNLALQLDAFLNIATLTTVGLRDTSRDRALRKSPELDVLQGRTRVERARRWVEALVTASLERGLEPQHHFATVDDVGHDFRSAVLHGLPALVWPFLTAPAGSPVIPASTRTSSHAADHVSE